MSVLTPAPDKSALSKTYPSLPSDTQKVLAAMAVIGTPLSQTKWLNYLNTANIRTQNNKAFTLDILKPILKELHQRGFIYQQSGYTIVPHAGLIQTILPDAMEQGWFEPLYKHFEATSGIQNYGFGAYYLRDYRQSLVGLRLALWSGQPLKEINSWLLACSKYTPSQETPDPFVEIFLQAFNPTLFDRVHPNVQEEILGFLLVEALSLPNHGDPEVVAANEAIRQWAENRIQKQKGPPGKFQGALAMDRMLRGELDKAETLVKDYPALTGQIHLLRGNLPRAVSFLDEGLKLYRKNTGRKTGVFSGPAGLFFVLAMLRSPEPKCRKAAETYISAAQKQFVSETEDDLIRQRLFFLQQVLAGLAKPEDVTRFLPLHPNQSAWVKLLTCMLLYWMGNAKLEKQTAIVTTLYRDMEALGFHWLSAQVADLLDRIGVTEYGKIAEAARASGGYDSMADWFERQEPWQRQLSALMQLSGARPSKMGLKQETQSRLIWHLTYHSETSIALTPLEQKQDARGEWTKGRTVALKRLLTEKDKLAFLTVQDKQAISAIQKEYYYYGSAYEIDVEKALPGLIGHPALFWADAPQTRVELLRGEAELVVSKQADCLKIRLHPRIDPIDQSSVLIYKETPTRLRLIQVTTPHRQIAGILDDELTIPMEAEQHVLQMISAIAPLITVQSDVGQLISDIRRIEADTRLHALLLPYQQGLKMQLRVRPFGDAGPYYPPGGGSENVISEMNGAAVQARRDLKAEAKDMQAIMDACPALQNAEFIHDEWHLEETDTSLDLLLQLQAQGDRIKISWPEGEKFKMAGSRVLDGRRFRLSIQRDRDWFAVSGDVQLDEHHILDLQKLLELVRQSPSRFVALGENEFLALTEEFQRRLADLAHFSEQYGKTTRIHPLAAFALEDLAGGVEELHADQHWQQHLQRLHELDTLDPKVPTTLQAELRDYQREGFRWLSRLAHWGAGACLADDMGLGKTVQMLAVLLDRASMGPALVVAPTSVCANWLSESARFAPSLNTMLFGSGDREQQLAGLKPFDAVIVSYGLLQQESELFAGVKWHTIILDEAQAIKNAQTLRSQAVMALSADFRIIATGTPLENHLGELWNLFRFINPGLLGSIKQFNERYAGPIERQQDTVSRHRLRRLIQPFMLRRNKSQVLTELPSRTEIKLDVELNLEERALYEALRRSAIEHLDNLENLPPAQRQLQVFAEMMKLRRACCNPNLVAPELGLSGSKLAVFGDLVGGLLENKHKALVFSQFVDHLTLIREYLDRQGIAYQYLDGATPLKERKKRVDAFQAGQGDLFLISLKAGGTGLNLTAADYVIHMDPWWNPAVEDQASDRAHRMGQQRPVTIYRLVTKHTIEEAIVSLHTHKRDLADSLLEGTDLASRMSAQDMLTLLQEALDYT